MSAKVHPTAEIEPGVILGDGTQIWHYAHVRRDAVIGRECRLGRNVFIDFEVIIGERCKIQNNCSIYHGSRLGDGVFIGPHVILLNDKVPRAVNADDTVKQASDWAIFGVTISNGASIGGRATLMPGVRIGSWAMVGAGAVITRDVPDFGLVYGNPGKLCGYVDRTGANLLPMRRENGDDLYQLPDGSIVRVPTV